jgi:carbon storage regulator
MLVLSRKQGEAFFLGDDIEIVILDVEGGAVKVGIRAPREVLVLRRELKLTCTQNESAAVFPSENAVTALLEHLRRPSGALHGIRPAGSISRQNFLGNAAKGPQGGTDENLDGK